MKLPVIEHVLIMTMFQRADRFGGHLVTPIRDADLRLRLFQEIATYGFNFDILFNFLFSAIKS